MPRLSSVRRNPNENTSDVMLAYYRDKIMQTTNELQQLQRKEKLILKMIAKGEAIQIADLDVPNLKWRQEIRDCIEPDENYFWIATSTEITKYIAFNHDISAIDRNMKVKISSTLSLLYKEGEIGRTLKNGEYYYGLKKFFEEDGQTLKSEFQNRKRGEIGAKKGRTKKELKNG